jgi:stage III sporulation protein AA
MVMNCSWDTLVGVLPIWLRNVVDKQLEDQLLEVRIRLHRSIELVFKDKSIWLDRKASIEDLAFCINIASKYSPWASPSISDGFITIEGGHRIGICGNCVMSENGIRSISPVTSVCVRVARQFWGISEDLHRFEGSVLIVGAPGSGKTTLLRDLIQSISSRRPECICVVDEKREIFPTLHDQLCFDPGPRTDILSGCGKRKGIEVCLRNMSPHIIAVDEITKRDDCAGLLEAGWCGVRILATAHATDMDDLYKRPVYKPLIEKRLFDGVVVMNPDKTWYMERLK